MLKRLLFIIAIFFPLLANGQSEELSANPSHQLLWKITGKGLTSPSWLYGTIHVKDPRAFELSDQSIEALKNSSVLAMELHPDSVIRSVMMDVMRRSDLNNAPSEEVRYKQFSEFLNPSEQELLNTKLLTETGMGLDQVDPNQPGLFQHLLSPEPVQRVGKSTFLDAWLFRNAKMMGKEVVGLERLEEQTIDQSQVSIADAWRILLREENPQTAAASFDRLLDWYRAGDLDNLWKWTQAQWNKSNREGMARRNETITRRALKLLEEDQPCFIAVGVSHLPGEIGLIESFRTKGYTVEPVTASFSPKNQGWEPKAIALPWVRQDQSAHGFSLEWPVEPVLFVKEPIVEMHFIPDVGTGNVYYAGWIQLPVVPSLENEDEFLSTLTRFLSQGGKTSEVTYRKSITNHGFVGREMGLKYENGQFFRSRFYLRDNYVYLLLVGPGEDRAQSVDAKRFFEQFRFSPLAEKPWEQIASLNGGFSISMPPGTQELSQEIYSPEEGWTMQYHLWSGGDPETGANYTVRYNIFPPDLRPEDDQFYFESNLNRLADQLEGEVLESQTGLTDGLPSLQFSLSEPGTGREYQGKYLLRGSQSYMILVEAPEDSLPQDDITAFFDSFRFESIPAMPGQRFELSDFGVSLWFPTLPAVNTSEYTYSEPSETWAQKGTFYAQDTLNGTTWYYNRESYSRYASVEDTSEFTRQWTNALLDSENGDRLLTQEMQVEDGVLTLDVQVDNGNNHPVFRRKFWLRGHELHSLSAWLAPGAEKDQQAEHFFNSLTFLKAPPKWDLFQDKRPQLYRNLLNPDTVIANQAQRALTQIQFRTSDLPVLHQLMAQPLPDDPTEWGTREKIMSILGELNHPSSVPVIVQQLKEANQVQPEQVLITLSKVKQPAAAQALAQILQQQPPDLDFDADGYALLIGLTDSISLYRDWIEWLPKLSRSPDYELGTYVFLDYGLTTKAFSKKDLESHWLLLLERGDHWLKMEKAGLLPESSAWETTDFLQSLIKVCSHAGYLPEVGSFLREVQQANDPVLRAMALEVLTSYGYALDPKSLEDIAAHPRTRVALYRMLKENGKEDLFPKKYQKQVEFAESCLMSQIELFEKNQIEEMKLMDQQLMEIRGTKGRGYLFKFRMEGETLWKYGFSGLQPANKKEVLMDTRHITLLKTDAEKPSSESLFQMVQEQWTGS